MLAARVNPEHHPAPFSALESILGSYAMPEVEAFGNEAQLLGGLIVTETSKNLSWLFMESTFMNMFHDVCNTSV